MEIVFIGGFAPKLRKKEFLNNSKGVYIFNSDNFLYPFIDGISNINECKLHLLSVPFLGNYPFSYKKIYQKGGPFIHENTSLNYCIGSFRIPFVGLLSRSFKISSYLKTNFSNEKDVWIIVSSIYTPILKGVYEYKKYNKRSKVCLIVPDLPNLVSSSNNPIYKFLKKIENNVLNLYYSCVDKYVLLTDEMYNVLPIGNKPWIRIEGIYDSNNLIKKDIRKDENNTILYAGTLDKRYGIMNLLNAFNQIKGADYRLWICGGGNMKNEIEKRALIDPRIKYLGQKPSKEVYTLQKMVKVLVNPRTSFGEYTKYSFPSKTMEYLSSGTPCIMNKLPGVPQEYLKHIYIPKNESVIELKNKIIEVCNKDVREIECKTKLASTFILENKNCNVVAKKLIDFLFD